MKYLFLILIALPVWATSNYVEIPPVTSSSSGAVSSVNGGIGAVLVDLDSVLTQGNTSSQDIYFNHGESSHGMGVGQNNGASSENLTLWADGGHTLSQSFWTSSIDGNYALQLPKHSGFLPISVDGQTAADADGNIILKTKFVDEDQNLYFTQARVIGSPLTGFVSSACSISASTTVLGAVDCLDGNVAVNTTNIATHSSAIAGKEPSITAGTTSQFWNGAKSFVTITSDKISEVTNLFFTNARAIAATLTGYTSGAGTISASDTVLGAIQKLNGNATSSLVGPSSSTDEALVRFDGTTGKLSQNSVGTLTDAGVMAGLTGITSSGTATFTNESLSGTLKLNSNLADSTASGSSVSITNASVVTTRLTNAGLTSIGGYNDTTQALYRILINETGGTVTVKDEDASVTATQRIYTGLGADIPILNHGSITLLYNNTIGRHVLISSSGGLAPKTLTTNSTQTGNTAGAETDLFSYSIPAATLGINGNQVRFHYAGTFATSVTTDKRIKVKFGGTTVLDTGSLAATSAANWVIEGECTRTGATTQKCYATLNSSFASLSAYAGYSTAAETLSGAVTLKITGQGTNASDVVGEMSKVLFFP